MAQNQSRELEKAAGRVLGHGAGTIAGLVLMFAGVGMGVTIVMLPIGIPVGLAGLLLFLWGLFGKSEE